MNAENVKTAQHLIEIQRQVNILSEDFPLDLDTFRAFCCAIVIETQENRTINLKVLASYFSVSPATMTRHAKELERANFLSLEKQGREVVLSPTAKSYAIADNYLKYIDKIFSNT